MISYRTVCTAGRGATMQTISTQTNTDVRYIDKQSIHISWPPSVRTLDGSQLFPSTQSRSSTDFHEPSLWLCFQKVVLRYPEIWSFLIASQCIPMLAVHFPLRCRWNPHWNPSTPDRLQIDSRSTPDRLQVSTPKPLCPSCLRPWDWLDWLDWLQCRATGTAACAGISTSERDSPSWGDKKRGFFMVFTVYRFLTVV